VDRGEERKTADTRPDRRFAVDELDEPPPPPPRRPWTSRVSMGWNAHRGSVHSSGENEGDREDHLD